MATPTTQQHDLIHDYDRDGDLDEHIAKVGDEWAPKGLTLVDAKIVGGFAVGSWWEHQRGVVVEYTYL